MDNDLLIEIRDLLQIIAEQTAPRRAAAKKPLSKEQQADVEESMMSLDEWYESYKEEPYPAKAINYSGIPFNKQESDWVFNRLVEVASMNPKINGGTHVFKYLGKKYCPSEKNTVNCFACEPIKETFNGG